jgi:hypothetical protein
VTIRSTRKRHDGTALSSRQLIILAQRVDFYMLGEGAATLVQVRFNHRYGVGGKLEEI